MCRKCRSHFRSSAQSPRRITPAGAIGCHQVCSNRVMNPARRACCNQWLRTGNNQPHVEQTSPLFKREHELLVHKASASCLRPSPASMQATAVFTVSLKPEGFVILGSLAHETRPCRRLLSVGSHLCSQTASTQSLAGLHLP